MKASTIPIFLAFLVMGVADAMGPLSAAVKTNYDLSNVLATLLPFFVFIAFAAFSVPGGVLAGRIGKKKLLMLGLGLNAGAMAVPSLMDPSFPLLLACIFVLGVGTTFLQVAGNPIMHDVSPEGAYSRNLSLAQGFKGIGSSASSYLVAGVGAIGLFATMGWRGAFPLFCALMVVALIWVAVTPVDETKADTPPSIGSSLALLKNPVFAMAVLGIFLYVGAEVCMGTFLKPALAKLGMSDEKAALWGPSTFFILLTIGRLGAGVVLNFISARACFVGSAVMGLAGAVLMMLGQPALAIVGVVLAGLGFANIWPMLFSITVEEKPEASNELSGLMCMAISGGAVVPLLMGQMLDMKLGAMSFVVPAVCFAYLLVLSLKSLGGGKKAVA
ncbi:MAG: MFS transporter [Verrucomicrobiota bacterium JB025]|nr:MFS transporter [Verrucomicrobiota bacterium JB025]